MAKYKRTVRGGRLVASALYTRPEPNDTPRERREKSRCSTRARQALNLKNSRQKLEFLIAENFSENDYLVTFTFDDAHLPKNRAGVRECFRRFVRQLRRYRGKRGLEVRYIYVIEGKHGTKRWHIHVIINAAGAEDIEIFRSLWIYGTDIDVQRIEEREVSGLARYLTKEKQDGNKPTGVKAWIPSKNLRQPTVEHEFVSDNETLTAPPGCYVFERREETNEFGSFAYIKYLLPKRQSKRRKKRSACADRRGQLHNETRITGGGSCSL